MNIRSYPSFFACESFVTTVASTSLFFVISCKGMIFPSLPFILTPFLTFAPRPKTSVPSGISFLHHAQVFSDLMEESLFNHSFICSHSHAMSPQNPNSSFASSHFSHISQCSQLKFE